MKEQFEALRDGDRFWNVRALPAGELLIAQATTLADVIDRNTDIRTEVGSDAFRVK